MNPDITDIKKLYSTIEEINLKLSIIENKINKIEENANKMSEHIDFICAVYEKVKSPLHWVCNKVNNIRSLKDSSSD